MRVSIYSPFYLDVHTSLASLVPAVYNYDYIQAISSTVSSIQLPDRTCSDLDYTVFDFSRFTLLEVLEIGSNSFSSVNTFVINGLNKLEILTIGTTSVTQQKENWEVMNIDSSRSFHILNCAMLESIEIGRFSFSDYGGFFELKNLPKLYSIEIGVIGSDSSNFIGSSFVIEGIVDIMY